MAELHESLLVSFRKQFLKRGFRETRSPMPTFLPDVFAQRISEHGKVLEEIVTEAEIEATIFSDHTAEQLLKLDDYMRHRQKKRIKVRAYLLIPRNKKMFSFTKSLMDSLFPYGSDIKIFPSSK